MIMKSMAKNLDRKTAYQGFVFLWDFSGWNTESNTKARFLRRGIRGDVFVCFPFDFAVV